MKQILLCIGTRPEAIKLSPLLSALSASPYLNPIPCVTQQHKDLLPHHLSHIPSSNFHGSGNNLSSSANVILERVGQSIERVNPDLVIVQGDTTTAFAGALAAFYAKVPIAHVEAGLRTYLPTSPWPEELHRQMISRLAHYHFAPTEKTKKALIREGVDLRRIWVVGNTSIDALMGVEHGGRNKGQKRTILVTLHRRENQGKPLEQVCGALQTLSQEYPSVQIQFLLHPNPAISGPAKKLLSNYANITLLPPTDHPAFIQRLANAHFVITDSGGVQEEAPALGIPLLIIREATERPEGIEAGTARLIGCDPENIITHCRSLLEHEELLRAMSHTHYPYGKGEAAQKITSALEELIG